MPITIDYSPSPRGMADLAMQAGLGEYNLKREQIGLQRAALAQRKRLAEMQMVGQIGMRREGNMAAIQRMQLGEQIAQRKGVQAGVRAGNAQAAAMDLMKKRQGFMGGRQDKDLKVRRENIKRLKDADVAREKQAAANAQWQEDRFIWDNKTFKEKKQLIKSFRDSLAKFEQDLANNPSKMAQTIYDKSRDQLEQKDKIAFRLAKDPNYQVEDAATKRDEARGVFGDKETGTREIHWDIVGKNKTIILTDQEGKEKAYEKPDNQQQKQYQDELKKYNTDIAKYNTDRNKAIMRLSQDMIDDPKGGLSKVKRFKDRAAAEAFYDSFMVQSMPQPPEQPQQQAPPQPPLGDAEVIEPPVEDAPVEADGIDQAMQEWEGHPEIQMVLGQMQEYRERFPEGSGPAPEDIQAKVKQLSWQLNQAIDKATVKKNMASLAKSLENHRAELPMPLSQGKLPSIKNYPNLINRYRLRLTILRVKVEGDVGVEQIPLTDEEIREVKALSRALGAEDK
jgi:hypothetical protein